MLLLKLKFVLMQLQSEQQSLLLTVIRGNEFIWKTLPTVFSIQMIAEGFNVFCSKVSSVFQLILLFRGFYPDLRPLDPAWAWLLDGFGLHPSMVIFSLSLLKIFCIIALSSRNNGFAQPRVPSHPLPLGCAGMMQEKALVF